MDDFQVKTPKNQKRLGKTINIARNGSVFLESNRNQLLAAKIQGNLEKNKMKINKPKINYDEIKHIMKNVAIPTMQ